MRRDENDDDESREKRTSSAETIISFTKQKIFDNKLLFVLYKENREYLSRVKRKFP
jgi:hypothetical protein